MANSLLKTTGFLRLGERPIKLPRWGGGEWEGYTYFIPNGMEVHVKPSEAEREMDGNFVISLIKVVLLAAIIFTAFFGCFETTAETFSVALPCAVLITLTLISKIYLHTQLKRYEEPKRFNGLSSTAIIFLLIMAAFAIACTFAPGFMAPQQLGGTLLLFSYLVLVDQGLEMLALRATKRAEGKGKSIKT